MNRTRSGVLVSISPPGLLFSRLVTVTTARRIFDSASHYAIGDTVSQLRFRVAVVCPAPGFSRFSGSFSAFGFAAAVLYRTALAASTRWRAGATRNALGRRTGTIRCTALPTRTRGDLTLCAPAAVPQIGLQHPKTNTTSAPRMGSDERAPGHLHTACSARTLHIHAPPAPRSHCTRNLDRVPLV